jgi:hypothetical protein
LPGNRYGRHFAASFSLVDNDRRGVHRAAGEHAFILVTQRFDQAATGRYAVGKDCLRRGGVALVISPIHPAGALLHLFRWLPTESHRYPS